MAEEVAWVVIAGATVLGLIWWGIQSLYERWLNSERTQYGRDLRRLDPKVNIRHTASSYVINPYWIIFHAGMAKVPGYPKLILKTCYETTEGWGETVYNFSHLSTADVDTAKQERSWMVFSARFSKNKGTLQRLVPCKPNETYLFQDLPSSPTD